MARTVALPSPTDSCHCPDSLMSETLEAPSCSRNRSKSKMLVPAPAWVGSSPQWLATARVLLLRSWVMASSVLRPRLMPASSAPSTRTSNQVSMLRETNW